jgi:hypothetical protein
VCAPGIERQKLQQALHAVEHALRAAPFDADALGGDGQAIALLGNARQRHGRVERQLDRHTAWPRLRLGQPGQSLAQKARLAGQFRGMADRRRGTDRPGRLDRFRRDPPDR